jgi:hypothetical protein
MELLINAHKEGASSCANMDDRYTIWLEAREELIAIWKERYPECYPILENKPIYEEQNTND